MKQMQHSSQQQQQLHYQQHLAHASQNVPQHEGYEQGYQEDGQQIDQQQHQSTHLSPVNQSILQRLKQQQAQRIFERRQYELEQLQQQQQQMDPQSAHNYSAAQAAAAYSSVPGVELVPASGQFIRPSSSHSAKKPDSVHSLQQNSQRRLGNAHSQTNDEVPQQPQYDGYDHQGGEEDRDQDEDDEQLQEQQQPDDEYNSAAGHLLVMTIDLGEGKSGVLHIFEHDEAGNLAEEFCTKHNLTNEAMEILAKNIEANKQIVLAERKQSLRVNGNNKSSNHSQNNNDPSKNQNFHSFQQQEVAGDVRNNYYKTGAKNQSAQNLHNRFPQDHMHFGAGSAASFTETDEPQVRSRPGTGTNQRNGDYQGSAPQGDKQSIFDRLYNEAQLKEKRLQKKRQQENNNNNANHFSSKGSSNGLGSSQSARVIKKQLGSVELNLGEYLYHKGQQMKSNRQQNAEEYILLQMEKEKLFPFHPEINSNSQRICNAKRNEYGETTEDHLLKQGQLYKEKKDMLKSYRETEQVQHCTFRPQVNPVQYVRDSRSEYLIDLKKAEQQFNEGDNFEKLHEDARRRNQRKDERGQAPECSFHPKITRPPKNNDENLPFVDRMMKSVNTKEKKHQELRLKQKLEEEDRSEHTFTPAVGRPPRERNVQGLPVHEYLYNKQEELKVKHAMLVNNEVQKGHKASCVQANDASAYIVEKNKRERFQELFNALDSNGLGTISVTNIDINQVSIDIINFIAPILCQMEQDNLTINFEQFYSCIVQLSKKWEEKRSKQQQFEHKPTINHRSQLLQNRSPDKFKRLYDNGLESKKLKESKRSAMKDEQVQKELAGCTFKPVLHAPMKIYAFTDPKISKRDSNFFNGHHAFEAAGGDGQFRVTGIVYNTPTINSIQQ